REGQPLDGLALQAEMRLAEARGEPRAEDLQLTLLARQPELHAVPVNTRCALAFSSHDRGRPELADMPRHLGIIVVREHRDVAEQIVETVRLLEIIQLLALPDEIADRKYPRAEHGEKDLVGDQPGHRHGPPAGARLQNRVQFIEVRRARVRQPEQLYAVEERLHHPRPEQLDLASEQQAPHRAIVGGEAFPLLRHDIVLPPGRALFRGSGSVKHGSVLFKAIKNPPSGGLAGRGWSSELSARQRIPTSSG